MTKPSAQTWLWIHGWGMCSDAWGSFPSSFPEAEAVHRFIDFSACRTVEDLKRSVHEAIARDEPEVVVAWSMGAILAIEAFSESLEKGHACRVQRLIVFGGSLKFVHRDKNAGCPPRVLDAMIRSLEADREGTLRSFRAAVFGGKGLPDDGLGFTLEGLSSGLQYLKDSDVREYWPSLITAPGAPKVLWIHGGNDGICPVGGAPEQAVVIESAGHAPFVDRPEECLRLMEKFTAYDNNDKQ